MKRLKRRYSREAHIRLEERHKALLRRIRRIKKRKAGTAKQAALPKSAVSKIGWVAMRAIAFALPVAGTVIVSSVATKAAARVPIPISGMGGFQVLSGLGRADV